MAWPSFGSFGLRQKIVFETFQVTELQKGRSGIMERREKGFRAGRSGGVGSPRCIRVNNEGPELTSFVLR
jgi:hypothetical protein